MAEELRITQNKISQHEHLDLIESAEKEIMSFASIGTDLCVYLDEIHLVEIAEYVSYEDYPFDVGVSKMINNINNLLGIITPESTETNQDFTCNLDTSRSFWYLHENIVHFGIEKAENIADILNEKIAESFDSQLIVNTQFTNTLRI